jgi:hypothetical protein
MKRDLKTLKQHPEGGLVFPDGVRVAMAHRNMTGKPEDEQHALVGKDGVVYSPVFKTLKEANVWLDQEVGCVFVPGPPENN